MIIVKKYTTLAKVTFQFYTLPRNSRAVRETEGLFLCRKSVMQTEGALAFQAKLGEQGMAERREQQRRKDYVANQAYSLLCLFFYGEAIICCNSGLALSQRFREETRRELESRTIRHTSVHFQIGLLANSWKPSFNISYYKRKTRNGRTLYYPAAASSCTYAIEPPCTGR